MQTRKIKYHCHDDVADIGVWIKFAICPFDDWTEEERAQWVDENIDFKWFRSVGEAICYYEQSRDFPDILSVDIDCRELPSDYRLPEGCRLPQDFAGTEKDSTRGKALLEYAFRYFPDSIVFYFTGQVSDDTVWPVVEQALRKGIDVKKKNKDKGPTGITVDSTSLLRKAAEKYLRQYTNPSEKHAIREKVIHKCRKDLLKELVNTSKGSFLFSHLTVGWSNLQNDDEWKRGILSSLFRDITLAASQCFGVDGVKQATHDISQGYYKENDDNTAWHSKAIDQVNKLLETLSEVKSLLASRSVALRYLTTYEKHIQLFLQKLEQVDPKSQIPAVDDLTREVRTKFRFGTSPNSTPMKFGNLEPTKWGKEEFEIYLPVHLVYEADFQNISTKCDRVVLCALESQEKRQHPKTWKGDKQPVLHREFMIFEQDGNDEYSENVPLKCLPGYFEVFQSKGFELFGRMYLVLRRNNQLQVYDCTYKPPTQRDLNVLSNLSTYLEGKKATVKAFYIFEFQSWRQP